MTTEATEPRSGFPYGLTVVTLLCLAVLIGLGTWQLQRLAWKQALVADIAALKSVPSRPINAVLKPQADQDFAVSAPGSGINFARVAAACPNLSAAPFLSLYSVVDGQAGVRLISACPLEGSAYGSILVDRGFIVDTDKARPATSTDGPPIVVTGILRLPDKANFVTPPPQNGQWYARDIPAMAKALGVNNPAPVMLYAETSTNPELKALRPIAVPGEISNRHLEYALTWFGLAAALASVYVAMLVRRRRN